MYKTGSVSFDINAGRSNGRTTNIQFMTQDTGSAKLSFSFVKDGVPLPLSALDAKIVLLYADGSFYKKSLTLIDKVNGTAEYILSDEELTHYGTVKAEIKLYYTNGQSLVTSFFTFSIAKTLEDQNIVPTADYYIDDFETLRDGVNQTVEEISQTVEELREKFADLEAVETKKGSQEKADAVQVNLDKHSKDKSNPHGVTKAQIGLSAVTNDVQAKKEDFDKHTSDTSNPHQVTAAQVGLDKVDNIKQADYYAFRQHDNNGERHTSKVEKDKWNAGQLFKLTEDNGLAKYLSGADFNTVTDTGLYYMSSVTTALNAPVNNNGYLFVHNYGTYAYQEYTSYSSSDSTSSGRRKFMRNKISGSDSWTSWREFESVEGAQSKVDVHADKTDIHVTKTEKDKWNGGQMTKLTKDDGKRTQLVNETDVLALSSGYYYANGTSVKNNPVVNDSSWFNYDVIEGDSGRKSIIAWRSYDNTLWHATVHTNGVFKGWKRLITNNDFENPVWQNITLKNGATVGTRTPIYAKSGSLLLLRGHVRVDAEIIFGSIPVEYTPIGGAVVSVALSGTGGTANLIVYDDGDLKIKYPTPLDSNRLDGFYIDVSVPLQTGGTAT
ncbi:MULTISPECIES: BppU family phage baseplate upper protein [Bacillus]|uniref:BppU family phage baseplate upper protein n=1 Tax=Bacillus TaxID=1386 RepID=UPI0004586A1F|nr:MULTISPECIES: BppU family phage baseplate upper protein [Bacillus]AIW37795.1 bacteriophage-like protein [Bacillus subtilis]AHZ16271.1 SPBc2 prophage-derived protein YomR [Bacillus velezensis SQR9]AKF76289.1 bacteriophage-like protein [Bacillus velezensis]AKF76340.1 bacteriophage-like protein [Bacillus velezensis]AWD15507.1 hypothetical protein B9C53_19375 [Bacillus velezensis]